MINITGMNQSGLIDSSNSLDWAFGGGETLPMANSQSGPLRLHRIDPSRNMARFYVLSLQPTLFGGASLIRNWGRIGTNGQAMMETFDESADAGEAFARLERRKRRRGYAAPVEKA